jgi:hypothetical protein
LTEDEMTEAVLAVSDTLVEMEIHRAGRTEAAK